MRACLFCLVVTITLCASARTTEAAATLVDSCAAEESQVDGIHACALNGVLAGDLIVCYSMINNGTLTGTCSDTIGSSYSAATYASGNGSRLLFSCAVATTGGSPTVTVTLSAADYMAVAAIAIRGAASCTTADADSASGTGGTVATPALTTVSAGYSTAVIMTANTQVMTAGGGYTILEENESSDAVGSWSVLGRTTPASSTVTPTWTGWGAGVPWLAFGHTFNETPLGADCSLGVTGAGIC